MTHRIVAFRHVTLQVAPRLTFGVHTKDQNLGTILPGARSVNSLEWNMADGSQLGSYSSAALDLYLRVPFQVVVELLAGVPVVVKGSVRGYLNQINEHFPPWRELFAERVV